jgi:hypothetical protein
MHMVRHYHECMHVHCASVFEKTMIKDQGSGFLGQKELSTGAEAHIVGSSESLQVRKVPSIVGGHDISNTENQRPTRIVERSRPRLRLRNLRERRRGRLRSINLNKLDVFHLLTNS